MIKKYCASPDRYGILKAYARENRRNMTLAERMLWVELKSGMLGGKFLRQYIVGDYIVDFMCRKNGLVIEVDGAYHLERDQLEDDAVRQKDLERYGFRVIRFTNEDVLYNLGFVKQTIIKELQEYER